MIPIFPRPLADPDDTKRLPEVFALLASLGYELVQNTRDGCSRRQIISYQKPTGGLVTFNIPEQL